MLLFLKQTCRGGDAAYVYRTAPTGKHIAVEVFYVKATNPARRGVYVQVQPQQIEDGRLSFVIMSGFSVLAAPTARRSDKLLNAVAARVDGIAWELAQLADKRDEAIALVRERLAA